MLDRRKLLPALLILTLAPAAHAEAPTPKPEPTPAEPTPAAPAEAAEPSAAEQLAAFKKALGAIDGPHKAAPVGDLATIDVPEGYWFVPKEGTKLFDATVENLHDPASMGVLVKGEMDSVVYFSFETIGYVKDDDKDLDADELIASLREGTVGENAQRKAQGFAEIEITGWVKEPFYNEETRSLEWATAFRQIGDKGEGTSNYNTRRLGRDGVMSVVLATSPSEVKAALPEMNKNLASFVYSPGKDYASYKEGDKLAEIGLGALVVGGAGVALAKVGFFKKFWKILVGIGAVLVAGVAKLFGMKKKPAEVVASDDGDGGAKV